MKSHFLFFFIILTGLASCSSKSSPATAPTVRVRWATDPENLDPLLYLNSANTTQANNLMYFSLLGVNYLTQETVPLLVKSLPTVRYTDSLTLLSYHLQPTATWDDGSPVLAQDVAFTLAMMNCPGLPNEAAQAQFGFIKALVPDSTDPRHFTFVCEGQSPEYRFASGDFPIMPAHVLDPGGELTAMPLTQLRAPQATKQAAVAAFVKRYAMAQLARNPMRLPGCGPYRLTHWQGGRFLVFQRKTNWWGDQVRPKPVQLQAYPTKIYFDIIPDDNTAILGLRRGQLDVFPRVPSKQYQRLQQSTATNNKLAFYSTDSYELLTAGFNTRRTILRNRTTRQALSRLFNIPALIKGTQQGFAYRSVGLISPQVKQYYNDSLSLIPYDIAGAAKLLQQAGWQRQETGWFQGGTRLRLTLSYRSGEPAYEATALQFQAAAASLSIPVELRPAERALLMSQLRAGEVDMYLRPLTGNPDMFNFAPLLHSQFVTSGNYTGFGTPATDKLIEQLAAAETQERKVHLVRRFQRMMQTESPIVVLYFLRYQIIANRQLTDLQVSPLKPGYNVMAIRARKPVKS